MCNHATDPSVYKCMFPSGHTETTLAGRESNPESRESEPGWWYSFPAEGENVHWEQVNRGNCSTVRVTAKCVIDMIADAAGCTCNAAEATSCGQCVEEKLSVDQRVQLWNSALGSGGCPRQEAGAVQTSSAWPHGRRHSSPSPQRDEPEDTCGGPWKFGKHLEVYHIVPAGATAGVSEKNAGDARGDLDFIFGGALRAAGMKQYYDSGFVEVVHVSVDEWGQYMMCNHATDPSVYKCMFSSSSHTETTLA